jgi:hypothetical protein
MPHGRHRKRHLRPGRYVPAQHNLAELPRRVENRHSLGVSEIALLSHIPCSPSDREAEHEAPPVHNVSRRHRRCVRHPGYQWGNQPTLSSKPAFIPFPSSVSARSRVRAAPRVCRRWSASPEPIRQAVAQLQLLCADRQGEARGVSLGRFE